MTPGKSPPRQPPRIAAAIARGFLSAVAMTMLSAAAGSALADDRRNGPPVRLEQVVAGDLASESMQEKHVLKIAVAEEIAAEFFRCAERKNKPRSIHILDQFGNTIYAGRMDGQIADNVDVARLKAEAAAYFRESTHPWLVRAREDRMMAVWLLQLDQFTSPVGLPIIVESQMLGTVGIGGASGDCAHEALGRVLGPQPPLAPPAEE